MRKWKVFIAVDPHELEEMLNDLTMEHWEIVFVLPVNRGSNSAIIIASKDAAAAEGGENV